ncbi:copia protein [Tanacetum coccineum]
MKAGLKQCKRNYSSSNYRRNKRDERSIVVKNKARLVAQGFRQEERIDYDDVFALVAKIEVIMLFLAFASFMGFPVYQIDVESAFPYGTIEEEVYVHQPPGFVDHTHPNKVYKVIKALYGLHQAPRAWFQVTLKASHLNAVKRIFRYLKHQPKLGLWYPRNSPFELEVFSDSDYGGASLDWKSTTSGCQFLAEGEGSGEPTKPQPTPSPTQPSTGDQPPKTSPSHATTLDSRDSLEGTNRNEKDQVQTPHDSPLSGGHTSNRAKGALNLQELSILCTNLSNKVLASGSIKDAQAAEISALKSRIKKLEKKCKPSISHHRAWLKSVNRLSMKKKFRKKESVSKQGRKKSKHESTLDDSTVFDDQDADHGMEYMKTEKAVDEGRQSGETKEVKLIDDAKFVEDNGSDDKGGNAEELVSTARPDIDAARQVDSAVDPRTPLTTTSIFDDEDITMAQTLIKMKEEKAKEKGVSIKDVDESSRPARSILTLKPLPTIDPKDKGTGVLKELVHKKELAEMEKEREERQRQDQASVDYIASLYDEVQAKMDASEELAARLQMEERDVHNRRKAIYIKEQERDTDFMPIGFERDEKMIDKMNKKTAGMDEEEVPEGPERTKVEVKQEGREENIMKRLASLKIVPDEEEEINYEVLGTRYLIVNRESAFYHTDRYGVPHDYYRVFRANGSLRYIKTFTEMVSRFDRLDFIELHIHILALEDGTEIHMLAERRYPLIRETLERMMELRLTAKSEGEAIFDLLRFIQK